MGREVLVPQIPSIIRASRSHILVPQILLTQTCTPHSETDHSIQQLPSHMLAPGGEQLQRIGHALIKMDADEVMTEIAEGSRLG